MNNSAKYVIGVFGGVRETARKLNRNPSSVCRWAQRGYIPDVAMKDILRVAKRLRLDVQPADLVVGRS